MAACVFLTFASEVANLHLPRHSHTVPVAGRNSGCQHLSASGLRQKSDECNTSFVVQFSDRCPSNILSSLASKARVEHGILDRNHQYRHVVRAPLFNCFGNNNGLVSRSDGSRNGYRLPPQNSSFCVLDGQLPAGPVSFVTDLAQNHSGDITNTLDSECCCRDETTS